MQAPAWPFFGKLELQKPHSQAGAWERAIIKALSIMKRLRTILLVTISYWVSARLGLLLAVPPGYATAVWPPSGVGLGAVLICGYWVLPGIWLGSFLANVQTAFDGHAFFPSLLLPTGISLGAAAQACLLYTSDAADE